MQKPLLWLIDAKRMLRQVTNSPEATLILAPLKAAMAAQPLAAKALAPDTIILRRESLAD